MKREAFKMYLKPGCEAEYEKRHAAIWPELKALLSKNGVSDYSIYWDKETNILFAFQKTEGEAGSQDLGNTVIEPGSIWGGVPAKFIKKVDPEQAKELNQKIAHNYLMYSQWYK